VPLVAKACAPGSISVCPWQQKRMPLAAKAYAPGSKSVCPWQQKRMPLAAAPVTARAPKLTAPRQGLPAPTSSQHRVKACQRPKLRKHTTSTGQPRTERKASPGQPRTERTASPGRPRAERTTPQPGPDAQRAPRQPSCFQLMRLVGLGSMAARRVRHRECHAPCTWAQGMPRGTGNAMPRALGHRECHAPWHRECHAPWHRACHAPCTWAKHWPPAQSGTRPPQRAPQHGSIAAHTGAAVHI